jgi:hypothetical protein
MNPAQALLGQSPNRRGPCRFVYRGHHRYGWLVCRLVVHPGFQIAHAALNTRPTVVVRVPARLVHYWHCQPRQPIIVTTWPLCPQRTSCTKTPTPGVNGHHRRRGVGCDHEQRRQCLVIRLKYCQREYPACVLAKCE